MSDAPGGVGSAALDGLFADARECDDWDDLVADSEPPALASPCRSPSASPAAALASGPPSRVQRPRIMQCFYCLRAVPREARFVICDACDGLVACERCWDDARPDRGVEGRHVDWLEERRHTLLRRDRRLPRELRQWRRLRHHSFDMAHADWTRDPTHFSLTTYAEYDAAFTGDGDLVHRASAAAGHVARATTHVRASMRAAPCGAPRVEVRASAHESSSDEDD